MPDKQEETREKNGRWKSGISGNPKGRPKGITMTEIIKDIGDITEKGNDCSLKELVVRKAYEMAISGNMRAIEFITERIEGKVKVREDNMAIKPISEINFEEI